MARADGAREWMHDLCTESTVWSKGTNPNNPWKRCPQCLGDMGSWHDLGTAGDGNRNPVRK